MTKKKIQYGKANFVGNDLSPVDAKVKVTIYLDGDLLLEARRRAKGAGKKYQTFINEMLRELLLNQKRVIEDKEFLELKNRVSLLEKAVTSK